MRPSDALLGSYRPGTSMWHRAGVGWKYLAVLLLIFVAGAILNEHQDED